MTPQHRHPSRRRSARGVLPVATPVRLGAAALALVALGAGAAVGVRVLDGDGSAPAALRPASLTVTREAPAVGRGVVRAPGRAGTVQGDAGSPAPVAAAASTAAAPAGAHVVALGDSVPAGMACGCTTFVDRVGRFLADRRSVQPAVTNLARSGATSGDVLDQLDDGDVRAALAAADVVVVTVGANDFDASRITDDDCAPPQLDCYQPVLAQQADTLATVLDRIGRLQPSDHRTRVLVTGYWNVFLDGDVGRARGEDYVTASDALTVADNQVIASAARGHGATYVDLYAAFKPGGDDDTALLADDGDHPNDAGHAVIAAAVERFLA